MGATVPLELLVKDIMLPWRLVRLVRHTVDTNGNLRRVFASLTYLSLFGLTLRMAFTLLPVGPFAGFFYVRGNNLRSLFLSPHCAGICSAECALPHQRTNR